MFGKVFGANVDWISQHSVLPEYFRQQFYDTGQLFPEFAANIGGGQNIYNFSYYGLYSPLILPSYFLPFLKMSDYMIAVSLLCLLADVLLFYKWLRQNDVSKGNTCLTSLLFLLSGPLIFHSYNQIMFVNYMPFLLLGLLGVDRYFYRKKSGLFTVSVFLMIMTSFYFSIGGILVLVLYGIYRYLMKQKRAGRIRHLGFSAHGSYDVMKRFLEAYGEGMEFCQIQLNYLDWNFQDAKGKLELLAEHQLPVWVMEPLRGGKLAELSEEDAELLKNLRPDESVPAWAFRFLQSIPGVTMVLSGMSNSEQLRENIQTFEEEKPLNSKEMEKLLKIANNMVEKIALPCTACRYCVSHCPQGLDIPALLALYNEHCVTDGGFIAPMALSAIPEEKRPGACIGCRSCEAVCPQQIKVSEAMADFVRKLG